MSSSEPPKRGIFVLFEGIDRVGKTTARGLLANSLEWEEQRIAEIAFPDRSTPTGEILDRYLKKEISLDPHTAHLLFSANRWEKAQHIIDLLNDGVMVLVDRYGYSGIAYSMAKGTLNMEWACTADVGLPAPDIIFYLEAEPSALATRKGYGNELFDNLEFQHKVVEAYKTLREQDVHRDRWLTIDATGPSSSVWINAGFALKEFEKEFYKEHRPISTMNFNLLSAEAPHQ